MNGNYSERDYEQFVEFIWTQRLYMVAPPSTEMESRRASLLSSDRCDRYTVPCGVLSLLVQSRSTYRTEGSHLLRVSAVLSLAH
jgi:hypothetical protein